MAEAHVTIRGDVSASSFILWGARIDGQFYTDNETAGGWGTPTTTEDAPWTFDNSTPNPYSLFVTHAGKKPTAIHWGGSGTAISAWDSTAESDARSYGAISNYSMGGSVAQLTDLLNNTNTNGGHTAFDALVNGIKTSAHPMIFRPLWEMNGNWGFKWQRANFTASQFQTIWRNMWQRAADIMGGHTAGSGAGTDTGNMTWFWCPNWADGSSALAISDWFPGADYVDWVGLDGYNKNDSNSPSDLFDADLDICRLLAPGKPLGIGETGCEAPTSYTGGKTQWVEDFFTWVAGTPDLKFFSWFNEKGNPLLPHIEVGPAATTFGGATQTAWAAGIADDYYQAGGTDFVNSTNFPDGEKVSVS